MAEYDVVVVGGGSAGIGAALGAARLGARTLLVERHAFAGGAGSASLVHTVCGLYHPDASKPPAYANRGIAREFGEALRNRSGISEPVLMGKLYVLPHHPSAFSQVADDLLSKAPQLDTWFHSECGTISSSEGGGWDLEMLGRPSSHPVHAKVIVDASGDATVAQRIGADREIADSARLLRPAYIFALHGIEDGGLDEAARLQLAGLLSRAIADGQVPEVLRGTAFRSSPFAGEAFVTIDLEAGGGGWDPDSPAALSELEATGRSAAWALADFLREHAPGFAKIGAPTFPARAGIRESWRWAGEERLGADDIIGSRRWPDDEIALGAWPIELRETARGAKLTYPEQPEPYGIPLGCLTAKGSGGRIFTAGRCLSASHRAMASLRVMGTALATGQAAGSAAAMAAQGKAPEPGAIRALVVGQSD